IMEPEALSVDATTEAAVCFGDASGSIAVTVIGGTAAYTYSIGGASQSGNTFNAVEAGDYTVTVVDANLCSASVDVTVDGAASALAVSVDGFGGQDADGGFINITVTGGGTPYTFDWTGSNGFDSSNEDVSGLNAGTYNVIVTDAYGCEVELSSDITITGVGELINGVSLTMTPNPTRGKVALNFSGLNGDKLSYTIMDTQGRVVVSKELGNLNGVRVENIDLTAVAAGVYYVNVRIDESTEVLKLIKQ
ncbi:MAG: T9SS type A sorting domain-containing protein, partial [Flavobacteriales bacterium]